MPSCVLQGHGAELRVDAEAERTAVHDTQVRAVCQHARRQLRAGADGAAGHAARPGAPRAGWHDARWRRRRPCHQQVLLLSLQRTLQAAVRLPTSCAGTTVMCAVTIRSDASPHNCAGAWRSGCGSMAWSTSAASTTAPPLAAAASRWSPPTTLQSVSSCTPEDAAGQLQPHAGIVIMSIENRSSTAQLAAAHLTPILLVTFKHPTLCLTSTPCGLLFAYVLVS